MINVKKDFPIFKRKIDNKEIIYLDSAATTQKPKIVIDKIKLRNVWLMLSNSIK